MAQSVHNDEPDNYGVFRVIIDLIGFKKSVALAKKFGGHYFWMPSNIKPDNPLVAVIGMAGAETLANHFGGDRIYISKAAAHLRRERNQQIIARFDQGATIKELVQDFDLCDRQIWRVVNGEVASS
jgi:Mor family transcriptional regulator